MYAKAHSNKRQYIASNHSDILEQCHFFVVVAEMKDPTEGAKVADFGQIDLVIANKLICH